MIDILLPFYGDPALMRQTVESVLTQRDERWRLLVLDDAYPDVSTGEWIRSLRHPRVEYHRNEHNLGANASYRKAVRLSGSPHLVVLGADDLLLPDFVGIVHRTLEAFPNAGIVQCGVRVIDGSGHTVLPVVDRVKSWLRPHHDQTVELRGESLLVSLLRGNWTYFPSLVWHSDTLQRIGFRPEFHVVQDLALITDLVAGGASMVLVPDIAFCYRRHAGSDSSLKTVGGSRFEEELTWFETAERELRAAGHRRAARAARVHLTSRLHAASLLPSTALARNPSAMRRLLKHAVT